MKKAKTLILWSILMTVATILLVLVSVMSGFHYMVFGLTIATSVISIIWVGVLLNAITE